MFSLLSVPLCSGSSGRSAPDAARPLPFNGADVRRHGHPLIPRLGPDHGKQARRHPSLVKARTHFKV